MKSLSILLTTLALSSSVILAADAAKTPAKATEIPAGAKVTAPAVVNPAAADAFKKLDLNHDGALSIEEFKTSPEAIKDPVKTPDLFKKLDKDGNGSLSPQELSTETVVEKPSTHGTDKPVTK